MTAWGAAGRFPTISARRAKRKERTRYEDETPRQFPFESARRVRAAETEAARKAIEQKLGKKRPKRGRPPKGAEKYTPVSIRLHPSVIAWAKREGKRRASGIK